MPTVAKRGATYDDLRDLPENVVGEIIAGDLYVSPRPAIPHAHATSTMGVDVGGPFGRGPGDPGGPGGWWILDEPELHLGRDVIVPDLAGWRRERLPRLPNAPAFELVPDWACEVLSPSTAYFDKGLKMGIYARAKVGFVWIVDPMERMVEAFRLEAGSWIFAGVFGRDDAHARIQPFHAIELDLNRWWLPAE